MNTSWNVSEFIGRSARIRLVDASGGGWGHINFDDVKFEYEKDIPPKEKPIPPPAKREKPSDDKKISDDEWKIF